MRVAIFHNSYVYHGGEDVSTAAEVRLLKSQGIGVHEFGTSNAHVLKGGPWALAAAVYRSAHNRRVYDEVRAFCRRARPSVAHVENFWFALSPSVHAACHAESVPTVQGLRNFRLLCVGDRLLRNDRPCNDCVGRGPWRGVLHRCKNDSLLESAFVARMIGHNRRRGTWEDDVDAFIANTSFVQRKLIDGGLPERIHVVPNFVADPGPGTREGRGIVFVGRLSLEKGLWVLLDAWRDLGGVPLTIVGEGPLRRELEVHAHRIGLENVKFLESQPHDQCLEIMRNAEAVVVPSIWYEGFGRVLIEAFSVGRPVIASRLGSLAEVVEEGRTGIFFEPGDSADLAAKVRWLYEHPADGEALGRAARMEYERKYTPERCFPLLMNAYDQARARFEGRRIHS